MDVERQWLYMAACTGHHSHDSLSWPVGTFVATPHPQARRVAIAIAPCGTASCLSSVLPCLVSSCLFCISHSVLFHFTVLFYLRYVFWISKLF